IFTSGFDNVSSTIKLRSAGFADCLDTENRFLELFDRLAADRVIPPLRGPTERPPRRSPPMGPSASGKEEPAESVGHPLLEALRVSNPGRTRGGGTGRAPRAATGRRRRSRRRGRRA